MQINENPTMRETYHYLMKARIFPGRFNGKEEFQRHMVNIMTAVTRQIKLPIIITRIKRDAYTELNDKMYIIGGPTIYFVFQCPYCHNSVKEGQKYCHECGQALQYDY